MFGKLDFSTSKARSLEPRDRPSRPSNDPGERAYNAAAVRMVDAEQRIGRTVSGQAFLDKIRSIG